MAATSLAHEWVIVQSLLFTVDTTDPRSESVFSRRLCLAKVVGNPLPDTKGLSEDTLEFTYLFSRADDGEKRAFGDDLVRIGVWRGRPTDSDSDDCAPGA